MLRLTTGLALFAALAGCGSGQKAGNAPNAAAPANITAAPAPAPAANAVAGDEASGLAAYREDVLRGCIAGGRETAAPGTPVERHCACAVERTMAGRTLAQLQADERAPDYETRFQGAITACIDEGGG